MKMKKSLLPVVVVTCLAFCACGGGEAEKAKEWFHLHNTNL